MSATTMLGSGPDDPGSEPASRRWRSSAQLEYAVGHVFLPAHRGYRIPEKPVENNDSFARAVYATADAYSDTVDDSLKPQWRRITRMLDNLQAFLQPGCLAKGHLISQLREMQPGDMLVFLNKAQDAGIIFMKQDNCTLYHSVQRFRELQSTFYGSHIECSIEIPGDVFHNQYFQSELANFLLHLDGFPGQKKYMEDTTTEFTRLLTSIFRSVGRSVEVPHMIKPVHSHYKLRFWKRSLLWLLIKLAIQTSLGGGIGNVSYKAFLLHVMCNLAKDAVDANLASDLLHAISAKALRRFSKLGPSAPNWLRDMVAETIASLRDILEARWKEVEAAQHPSTLWVSSQLDLDKDTQLSLVQSTPYIHDTLHNLDPEPLCSPFRPEHLLRGTLNDFLSSNGSFFEEAYPVNAHVTLYDVEQGVQQGIDGWVACVTDVGQACVQLVILMDKYLSKALGAYKDNLEHVSIMLLTAIELWVALDKLVLSVVPTLVDYSPGIQIERLHRPLFRESINLYRLFRAYQYLSTRHSQSLPGRYASLEAFTRNMFPVRYHGSLPCEINSENFWRLIKEHGATSQPNVALPESQCPLSLHIWRSGTAYLNSVQGNLPSNAFVYRLPSGRRLDQYVRETSHTSNEVLAAQVDCPHDLSLHEFIAFGHLRSGASLQWMNILRELRSRTLNIRRHDVHLLLTQAASQSGPLDLNTMEWEWHQELQQPSFCHALLDELESLLEDVAVHSLDGVMMGTISLLLTRLLSSSPCEGVEERAIGLLRRVRRKTFRWVQALSQDLMTAPTKTERSDLLRDMAATCRSTFDVGPNVVDRVLCSAEDVDALLFCAVLIHANTPIQLQGISEYSRLLLERDRRLSLAIEHVLRDVISADGSNRGIDLAVQRIWYGYCPGPHDWQSLPLPHSHWLTCETVPCGNRLSQVVQINLLNGTLLVDGKPIEGLSREIREQSTYKRIFGDQRFLVVASNLPGMDFCSLSTIHEHWVHFALRADDLVIQAQHKDTPDILQVIPREQLQGDLPTRFVNGHVHWLNLSTSTIEIRSLKKVWEPSSKNWRIDCASGQYRMYKGRDLDIAENLIITISPIDSPLSSLTRRLSVVLPRYGLSFFINENGQLESHDFKNMVYDENQCVGTLFGLENRLVLRPHVQVEEDLVHKCIIIPEGQVSLGRRGNHVRATTFSHGPSTRPVTYHTYYVNTELGCLTGYAGWRSKMYLARLHAETSVDWMPDPLTGRTGIQEALCLLRSAGCRSIMELDVRHEKAKLVFSVDQEMYPQIKFALKEIEYLIEREKFLRTNQARSAYPPARPELYMTRALRTAYLFPFEVVESMPTSHEVKPTKFSDLEELARVLALAVHHWLVKKSGAELWSDTKLAITSLANLDLIPPSIAEVEALLYEGEQPRPEHKRNRSIQPPSIAEVGAFLQQATAAHERFRLLFLLPTMVYCRADPQPCFLSILAALAKHFPLENPPCYDGCRSLEGFQPSRDTFKNFLTSLGSISWGERDSMVDRLFGAWPSQPASLVWHTGYPDPLVDLDTLLSQSIPRSINSHDRNTKFIPFLSGRYHNLELVLDLTRRLVELETKYHASLSPALPSRQIFDTPIEPHPRAPWQVTLDQLFRDRRPPNIPSPIPLPCCDSDRNVIASNSNTPALAQLLASFRTNKTTRPPPFQQQYIRRLHDSAQHVREVAFGTRGSSRTPSVKDLQRHHRQCKENYVAGLTILKEELGPKDDAVGQALDRSGQWPQITPDTLFRCLASTSPVKLSDSWKECLVSLALLLLELQRARRLIRFALDNVGEEFLRELKNEGCDGWRAEDYPDWLLMQLQGNFLVRGIQADTAMNMISPPFGENTVLQVNMGEGKSYVILPISAAVLADGNQLVRVVVPKALVVQMFRLLVDRLGGLVNRRVYYIPFSRSLTGRYSNQQFGILRELLSECMRDGGILVAQPEHLLSLKLTSVEAQIQKDFESRGTFLELQRLFDSCARDILDESDEVLQPRFQLMYTIGPQQDMEGCPDRWTIIQQVLRLMKNRAVSLSQTLPDAIEYERSPSGSFPCIRITRASDARQLLISLIVEDVMDGRLPGSSFRDIGSRRQLRRSICEFISAKEVLKQTAKMVEEYARQTNIWNGILLLRGLLACDILLFALSERRWHIDYGLSPNRTMLAVPYRAKGVPAPTAEFGHPDITIVLTCLSYYYGGLTEEQLRTSFEILQEQDDPSAEYSNWLRDFHLGSVPESIRDLRNINIKSSEQWDKYLFPLFSRNQGAVDFYLSRVVFPREGKEFPWKFAASSWDLAELRERPITGFSGTNDCQYLLPTSVAQHDLDHQLETNARVLSYLLMPENNFYAVMTDTNGVRRTTSKLLKMAVDEKPEIRVLLDVGAQILDLSNLQVAKAWLDLSSDSDGAIYFNEDDELMVLSKDDTKRPLQSSPLAQQLHRCVIYLDDAHTRGTDLKLPVGSRAAVTLGPKVTKDRLVQGCMRMRKLGHGHSVMFFSPLEVDRSIRILAGKEDHNVLVTATDILCWAIHETWIDIQRRAPYWAQQGINHHSRYDAWIRFCNDELASEHLANAWLQPELKSLADLYAPRQIKDTPGDSSALDEHPEIQQQCIDLGVLSLPDAQMEEEQEREVHREIEREREVQRRLPNATPAKHSLHPDVVAFVRTGVLPPLHTGSVFHPVFSTLKGSSAATSNTSIKSPSVLATSDFSKTIELVSCGGEIDQFLRPVQWVLSGKKCSDRILVLLSPFEADRLMPDIRVSKYVHLHVYTPRTSERMRPADDLKFYSIPPIPDDWTPPWDLTDQLNVFAGQLYLRDYESYLRLCRLLGLQKKDLPRNLGAAVRRNPTTAGAPEKIGNKVAESPLSSLTKLLGIRRRDLPFGETHMGRILQGEKLTERDFKSLLWTTFDGSMRMPHRVAPTTTIHHDAASLIHS